MAPILIFVYNRLDHTIKTIESLSKNINADKSDVYIFSDGAKKTSSIDSVNEVREYVRNVKNMGYFKNVYIFESKKNNGLANSIINGVTQIIAENGKVIVLEDDLVSSVNFINYMNDALDYYAVDETIWSISGFNIPIEIPSNYNEDVYLSLRGCSWGWATWQNRWEQTDWEVKDYPEFSNNSRLKNQFNQGGRDLSFMLEDQMAGKIDSWAIRWCYSQFKLNKYTVYPVVSMIRNIGLDGSGTHKGNTNHFETLLNNSYVPVKFSVPPVSKELLIKFQDHYMDKRVFYKEYTKRKVKKIIGR